MEHIFDDNNVTVLFTINYLVIKILVMTEILAFVREQSCSKGSELGLSSSSYSQGPSGPMVSILSLVFKGFLV